MDMEVKRIFCPILEWLIWSYVKERNEETSTVETDMTVVTLSYQKLKSRQKLWIEGKFGKWPEAQRVATPQINTVSAVAAQA